MWFLVNRVDSLLVPADTAPFIVDEQKTSSLNVFKSEAIEIKRYFKIEGSKY